MPLIGPAERDRRLDRHAAWHRRSLAGGPLVHLVVKPLPEDAERLAARHRPPVEDPDALVRWWADPEEVIPRIADQVDALTHLGDAVPHAFINLGPGALAAFMGCESVVDDRTIWQKPLIDDWGDAPQLALQEDSFYWRAAQELTRASINASDGRWLTSITDVGGALDILSYMRTPEKLCTDLIDHPDEVKRAEAAIIDAWAVAYDRLYPLIESDCGGSCGWIPIWYPGRTYPLQCDFSCMISPAAFHEFAMPSLRRQCETLETAIYHLDGPDAIRHLDAICELPAVTNIQWVPGAGASHRVADWLELYRRILELGCGIWMGCTEDELELCFEQLDPDRLCLVMVAEDRKHGDRILSTIDRLRRGRLKEV